MKFYNNNPFQRPMFGSQYGALGGFGSTIMDQIGRKEQGNIGSFLGEVQDMAEDRFEIDFGGQGGIGGIGGPVFAYGQKTQNTPNMQMFKEGGAAFPDLSGDGKVTRKDILMGRGVLPMQEGGAPMYADQGSQFMPAVGRPPVPASVQMANELDQIGRMQQQRESTIVQKIAEQRGVSVEEVLRLLALANAAGASAGAKAGKNVGESAGQLVAPFMVQAPTNIPYPDAPSATVMQQGGPNPSEWDMLTEGEKMRIMNNLEMGNVPRPEVAVPMQEGGNVGIGALPQLGAEQPSPPMPAAPMAGIDPAMVEQALSQMEGQVPQIDDAEDYEQMMNTIRGDEQPMEARYSELAGVVGEEDAAQTPESVLALVQPVMVMASVDQGIGGLAQEEMTQPIEGEMAGGIMTMAGQPQEVGNTPPVNFKHGGVVRLQTGGNPILSIDPYMKSALKAREDILGTPEQRASDFEEQKKMTQANILFDLAQAGLIIAATPPTKGESPAATLARAAASSEFFPKVGARSAELQKFKQSQKAQETELKLDALKSAEDRMLKEEDRLFEEKKLKIGAANDIAKLMREQAFASTENMKDRGSRENIVNLQLQAQRSLAELSGDQSLESIAARGVLEKELANLNNNFRKTLQDDDFNFRKEQTESAQAHSLKLEDRRSDNLVKLEALRFDNTKEGLEIKNRYYKENMRIEKRLTLTNQLIVLDKTKAIDFEKIDKNLEGSKALANLNASLKQELQDDAQAFTAIQNAYERIQRKDLQKADFTFREALQESVNAFNMDENRKDRVFKQAESLMDRARQDRQLDIAEERLEVEKAYKEGKLALEEAASEANLIGSKNETARVRYINDVDRLTKYAQGNLGDETGVFETALITYYSDKKDVFDGQNYIRQEQPEMPQNLKVKLQERVANGLSIPEVLKPQLNLQTSDTDDSQESKIYSQDFKRKIFTPEAGLNRNSKEFARIPLNVVDESIAYPRATGFGELRNRIGYFFSEVKREVVGGEPLGEKGMELSRADRDIENIREAILQELLNFSDQRVLKATQDAIRKNAEGLTAGLFTSDERALSTLNALGNSLEKAFESYAQFDPDYNPQASRSFNTATINDSRKRTTVLLPLIKEVDAMKNIYSRYLDDLRSPSRTYDTPDGALSNYQIIQEIKKKKK